MAVQPIPDGYHTITPYLVIEDVGGLLDFLAKGRMLPPLSRGDLLTVFSAGAYGAVMGSQYNSRPRPPMLSAASAGPGQ